MPTLMKRWSRTRRAFLKTAAGFCLALIGLAVSGVRSVAAGVRRILPPGTDPRRLFNENPEQVDTRHLPITPIRQFDTMGDTAIDADLSEWELAITGAVDAPLRLSYADIAALPAVSQPVLLICPGVFSFHAEWKGVSIGALLNRAGAAANARRITVYGRSAGLDKKERFRVADLEDDAVFLAYSVNGQPLPRAHGFPLRLVARDHWGDRWVKYVYKIAVDD